MSTEERLGYFGIAFEGFVRGLSLDFIHQQESCKVADGPNAGSAKRQLPCSHCSRKVCHGLDVQCCPGDEHQRHRSNARDGGEISCEAVSELLLDGGRSDPWIRQAKN